MENSIKPTNHIIAYVDILGTTALLKNEEDKTTGVFSEIYEIISDSISKMNKRKDVCVDDIKFKIFSDNIVFSVPYSTDDELLNNSISLIMVLALFQYGIFIRNKLTIRGGICYGNLHTDELFVLGKGLIQAYQLENENSIFPRIILDDKISNLIISSMLSAELKKYIMKDFDYYFINFLEFSDESTLTSIGNEIELNASSSNAKISQKYKWFKCYYERFIEKCRKDNDKTIIEYDNDVHNELVSIKLFGEIAAGYDRYSHQENEYINVPNDFLQGNDASNFFAFIIKGCSMNPDYHDGDIVIMKKIEVLEYNDQILGVTYDEEQFGTLKKVRYVSDAANKNIIELEPLNSEEYDTIVLKEKELEHFRIMGKPYMIIRYMENNK